MFGTLDAKTVLYVNPWSVDSNILTFAVFTPLEVVPATSQVTVSVLPLARTNRSVFCDVTLNGPAAATVLTFFVVADGLFGFKKLSTPLDGPVLNLCFIQLLFYLISFVAVIIYVFRSFIRPSMGRWRKG